MAFGEWWESTFGWLDPRQAEGVGLVTLGFLIMAAWLGAAYFIAWLWHRMRDNKGGGPEA